MIILLNLTRTRFYFAQPLYLTQIFWNAFVDMAMTPCGLRPFEPQCLWYDVSNWLPSVPCVTGMPNGRQAHHRLCYRPPYTQSLLTTPSITTAALRMASGKMRSSASFSILIATQPIARCMHGLSNSLTRANLPSSPACPASPLLAHYSPQPNPICKAACRASGFFRPATGRLA